MKRIGNLLVITAALAAGAATADSKVSATLMGTWTVDTSRLPIPIEARPKSVMITFTSETGDRLRTKVEVVGPTGAVLEADGVTPLDGSPTPVKSNFEADVSATSMPRPEVLIMQLAKNGSPASTRIYSAADDGRSMIETVAYFDANGRPVLRRNFFSRVR